VVSRGRTAVERTSVYVGTLHPSRGGAGTGDLSGGLAPLSRHNTRAMNGPPGGSNMRERVRLS